MSNGFDWRKFAPRNRFATLAAGGLVVVLSGLFLPMLFPAASSVTPEQAAAVAGPQPPVIYDGPSLATLMLRLLFGIVTVSGLIVVTASVLKRRQRPRSKTPFASKPVEILGTMVVGRGLLYHVKIGNHHLLAGADATGFRSLVQLPAPRTETESPELNDLPTIISERVRVTLPHRT